MNQSGKEKNRQRVPSSKANTQEAHLNSLGAHYVDDQSDWMGNRFVAKTVSLLHQLTANFFLPQIWSLQQAKCNWLFCCCSESNKKLVHIFVKKFEKIFIK